MRVPLDSASRCLFFCSQRRDWWVLGRGQLKSPKVWGGQVMVQANTASVKCLVRKFNNLSLQAEQRGEPSWSLEWGTLMYLSLSCKRDDYCWDATGTGAEWSLLLPDLGSTSLTLGKSSNPLLLAVQGQWRDVVQIPFSLSSIGTSCNRNEESVWWYFGSAILGKKEKCDQWRQTQWKLLCFFNERCSVEDGRKMGT